MAWLFQNLFSSIVYSILILLGGIAVTFLKKKRADWAGPILYGIGTVACLLIIFFTVTGHGLFSNEAVTADNLDGNVKKWISSFGFSRTSVSLPNAAFAYNVQMPDGVDVIVGRETKDRPGYLQCLSSVSVSPEHQIIMNKLSPQQALEVVQEVRLDLAMDKVGFSLVGTDANHIQGFDVSKAMPISALSENAFADCLDSMDSAAMMIRDSFVLALDHQNVHAVPRAVRQ